MRTNEIIEKALSKKGAFANIEWQRDCNTLKSCESHIEKRTRAFNVRIGCDYEHLKSTINGRADGTLPEENTGLKGKEWKHFPVVLTSLRSGQDMIRVETARNTRFEVQYYMDGKEIEKSEIMDYLRAGEKREGQPLSVFDIKVDNIKEIH